MDGIIVVEWAYTPKNFYEENQEDHLGEIKIIIGEGKIEAKTTPKQNNEIEEIINEVERYLQRRFLTSSLSNNWEFSISQPVVCRFDNQGRQEVSAKFLGSLLLSANGIVRDFQAIDKDGNIILDTKKERIDNEKKLTARIIEINDDLLNSLVEIYHLSIKDPQNSLVYLYKIQDALKDHFGSKKTAIKALKIKKEWEELGEITNDGKIKQSRHRISDVSSLRDITNNEIHDIKKIALKLIVSFLEYLEARTIQ